MNSNLPVILNCRFSRIRGLFRNTRAPIELFVFVHDLLQLLLVVLSLQLVSQLGRDAIDEQSTESEKKRVTETFFLKTIFYIFQRNFQMTFIK